MRQLLIVLVLCSCGGINDPDAGGPGIDGASDGASPGWDGSTCSAERCNGLDDDCDTMVDEDFPMLDMACDGADSDQCTEGFYVCGSDQLVTVCNDTTGDTLELCGGLPDDDCDGINDSQEFGIGTACDGPGDVDFCADATVGCDPTTQTAVCNDTGGSDKAEVCNGLNDDCDGQTDEGTCLAGQRCVPSTGCVCDASSCGNGCCASNMCHVGEAMQCGTSGGTCRVCPLGKADSCSDIGECLCGANPECGTEGRCVSGECRCGSGPACDSSLFCCAASGACVIDPSEC